MSTSVLDKLDERARLNDISADLRNSKVILDCSMREATSLDVLLSTKGGGDTRVPEESDEVVLKDVREGEENSKENLSGAAINRLFQKFHETSAELRSSELQLNHSRLQVQGLTMVERELREDRDSLQYALAESEQDKLLLEAKLQDVAGFEGTNAQFSLQSIRGQLLDIANSKITELTQELKVQQGKNGNAIALRKDIERAILENAALREELGHMSGQLAQRTILYSAQERRLNDTTRAQNTLQNENDHEVTQLRANLQQLEHRFEIVDRERLESILSLRQQKETHQVLEFELSDALERAQQLDFELANANTQNISLQAAVDHLRGANLDELERDLMADVETMRFEANAREEQLKRQLDNARELLAQEASHREQVMDEMLELRRDSDKKSELLRALKNGSPLTTPEPNDILTKCGSDDVDNKTKAAEVSPKENVYDAMFDSISPHSSGIPLLGLGEYYNDGNPTVLYGAYLSNAVSNIFYVLLDEIFKDLEKSNDDRKAIVESITLERIERDIKHMYSTSQQSDEEQSWQHICTSVLSMLQNLVNKFNDLEVRSREMNLSSSSSAAESVQFSLMETQSVSKDFLLCNELINRTETNSSTEEMKEELSCLKVELIKRKKNELKLQQNLKESQKKLITVLECASKLPPVNDVKSSSDDTSLKHANDEILDKNHEIHDLKCEQDIMKQQLDGYLEEIKHLEETAYSNHQIGIHEATDLYAEKIQLLEAELKKLRISKDITESSVQTESIIELSTDKLIINAYADDENTTDAREKSYAKEIEALSLKYKHESEQLVMKERESMLKESERLIIALKQDHNEQMLKLRSEFSKDVHEVDTQTIERYEDKNDPSTECTDMSAQTTFSASDSQVDQRIDFALARQLLQEENKFKHALEMQRLTLEREYQLDLHDKIATLHQEYESQLLKTRQHIKMKYLARLEKQKTEFEAEKDELLLQNKNIWDSQETMNTDSTGWKTARGSGDSEVYIISRNSENGFDVVKGKQDEVLDTSLESNVDTTMTTVSPPRWESELDQSNTPIMDEKISAKSSIGTKKTKETKKATPSKEKKESKRSPTLSRTPDMSKVREKGTGRADKSSGRITKIRKFPLG